MQEKVDGTRRPFATGSKPGPDAIDHFLEEKGFYRKHIARDASSLFRVVADQVYDIQNYHEKVRQDCAAYMESRPKEYTNEVDKNFFNYISQLRRPRTHGSLLELRVLARIYRKNVILFEPTSNLQTTSLLYVKDDSYDSINPLRVFYSHKDKHFDVIYTMDYVERLAECQAVVYNILYSEVFKLPDVQYAVERMLHDQEEKVTLPLEDDPDQYITQSGEVSSFDSHEDSNCVLKDPNTCHFHNQDDFEKTIEEHKDAITIIHRIDDQGRMKIFKPIDGFLHDKTKSCVRQLLDEGITPFPYKVAKALDPSIYRNTEFELWSENRKEQRLKWLDSADFPMKQQLDEKNFMYGCNRNRRNGAYDKFNSDKYEMIVDEDRYLTLDDEEKKKYVILDHSLDSYELNQLTNLDQFVPAKEALEMTLMPVNVNFRGGYKKRGGGRFNNNFHNQHQQQYTNSENQNQPQMAYVSDIERKSSYAPGQPDQHFYYQQQTHEPTHEYQQQLNVTTPMTPMYAASPSQGWSSQMIPYMPSQQQQIQYAPLNYQHVMPYGNYSIPPPNHVQQHYETSSGGDVFNIMSEAELSSSSVNWQPKESNGQNGEDLPHNDVASLQFFYNIGVRYFHATGANRRLDAVVSQLGNLDMNEGQDAAAVENVKDQTAGKNETPPVPTNTPVSTKMNPAHGNRFHGDNRNANRRPFGNREHNREEGSYRSNWSNQSRKEIKFNSNVKNLHKNESKIGGAGQSGKVMIHSQTFHAKGSTESNVPNQEKSSGTTAPTTASPTILHDQYQSSVPVYHHQQQVMTSQQPMMAPQQPGPGVAMIFQVADDSYLHQMPPGIQYSYPFQGQPQPVYYPVQQQQQLMDGSLLSSNDSGIIDTGVYHTYPQTSMPYYQQFSAPPVPMYYTPSLPATPQIAHMAPIFPATAPMQPVISMPPPVSVTPHVSGSASDEKDSSTDKS